MDRRRDRNAPRGLDVSQPAVRQTITRFIRHRLRNLAYGSDDLKDLAIEIWDRFGVTLTPGEIKDIQRRGW